MEEGSVLTLARPSLPPPKLVVAPRNLNEGFIHGGLNSSTPTPMAFFSSKFADLDSCESSKPLFHLLAEALASPTFTPKAFFDNYANNGTQSRDFLADVNTDRTPEGVMSTDRAPEGVELNEDETNHEDLETKSSAGYRAMMPSRLPITSSSMQFTIPPGMSPMSLESPLILFNSRQADPSPTTGSLSLQQGILKRDQRTNMSYGGSRLDSNSNDGVIFKPYPLVAKCESPVQISNDDIEMHSNQITDVDLQAKEAEVLGCSHRPACDPRHELSSDVSDGFQNHFELDKSFSSDAQKLSGVSYSFNGRLSLDDYNWKKYGEKQLKNCADSRSYYKCTNPGCTAKRLVERSQVGKITRIMYRGEHSHAKPQGAQRRGKKSSLMGDECRGAAHDNIVQNISMPCNIDDSTFCDLVSQDMPAYAALPITPELSFVCHGNEENEPSEVSFSNDDIENEHNSKHRWIENELGEPTRVVREPKVVIQTVTDVDVLDDGYRWRKYGQKVVKGHSFPRSYYRCSNRGCSVKKHAERSSLNRNSVITTYEGKHNHSVPAARGGSQAANVCTFSELSLAT